MTDQPDIDERHPLESIFHEAVAEAERDGDLTVHELLGLFGSRSLGPLLMLFGLIAAVPPIGAIPLVPTTMGVLTFLAASQLALGRDRVWVPGVIGRRGVGAERLRAGERRAGKVMSRVDALVRQRGGWLTEGPAQRLVAVAACGIALMMPPLELVPFGVAVPGTALIALGIGLVARDGVFLVAGLLIAAATLCLIAFAVPWGVIGGWLS